MQITRFNVVSNFLHSCNDKLGTTTKTSNALHLRLKMDTGQNKCEVMNKHCDKTVEYLLSYKAIMNYLYEGWNFNFGNTPLDWIQELLE